MSGPAQVRSSEAIERVAIALARFELRVQAALDALDAEVRRAADWVDHDRPAHWRKQVHEAEDGVHAAKIELERCLTYNTTSQERPMCREQKAALAAAKVHLEYCREKAEAVKRWQRNFRHESFEYDGRVGQLRRLVEIDVPKARGVLAKILRRLDEYQIEQAPDAFHISDAEMPPPATSFTVQPAASVPSNPLSISKASPVPSASDLNPEP